MTASGFHDPNSKLIFNPDFNKLATPSWRQLNNNRSLQLSDTIGRIMSKELYVPEKNVAARPRLNMAFAYEVSPFRD